MQKELFIVSPKIGDTMDHARSSYASASVYESASHRDFLCSTYKPHFFWDSFETLQVASYGRDLATLLVAQESKLCSGESKTSKILTIACIQAIEHSFFQINFIFSA